ncbi:hypothetical protein FSP39_007996 [Pinctada imbricata]|uniref:HAT C-terminal dimerisation domain-containing protein n=1 Tax=Pinctada imbricata TaxID=66713 RepID=A0AA89BSP2_PINIB|nr:hypothetical protein FSP39_007996 [Pinctada imbricata]
MFTDSKIAEDFSCGKTKTTQIINNLHRLMSLVQRLPLDLSDTERELLADQYLDYQLAPTDDLPQYENEDIDAFWQRMETVVDVLTDKSRFDVLCKLAKSVLVLPNSNADSERAFSIVKKIHTESRADLGNDTINSLLSCKFNQKALCYEYKPPEDVLKAAKCATMQYNVQMACNISNKN